MERAGQQKPAVHIAVTDPRNPAARYCLRAYFAELARRFDDGFDPARSIPSWKPRPPATGRGCCGWRPTGT